MNAPSPVRLLLVLGPLLASVGAQEPRLANLSTRALAGTGANVLTAGFVIGPGADKKVLVRAIGPTLGAAPFNLPGVLADPQLTVVNATGATIATNDDWLAADAATMSSVGAFPLPPNSKDAAIVTTLAPGSYTAQVNGAANNTGLALVEVYEVGATNSRLVNLSTRAFVGTGASVMIPGIVISPGTGTRRLLIRAAGPALGAFGLPGALADPTITIVNTSTNTTVATNDDWGVPTASGAANETALTAAFTRAGAFSFTRGSKDSALLVDLAPGNYGIQVSGVATTAGTSTTGLALVEVYDVTPPLAIFSVTPSEGPIAGGTTITLNGRGFAGATVLLDEQAVTPLAQSDSEIRLRMPAHDNGNVVISVRSATNTTAVEYLYVAPRLEDLPAGAITTFAGAGSYYRFEQPATLSRVAPWGIASAPNGDIYFMQLTPPFNFALRVRTDGTLQRVAGTTRPADVTSGNGDGGPALNATFSFARSIAIDTVGNFFIADMPRVRKIAAATGIITTIAGTATQGFSGDGGPAAAAQISLATLLALGPDGSVYFIDDENARIRKIAPNGIITTVAGNGASGQSGDGGPAAEAQIAGHQGDFGGIAVDADGNIFFLDTGAGRIRKIDARSGIIRTFASQDPRGRTLQRPVGLAVDNTGNVYTGVSGYLIKYDRTGSLADSWGTGTMGFSADGTLAKEALIGVPLAVQVAANGDLLWSDVGPARLRRINAATGRLETVAGLAPDVLGVPGRAVGAVFNSSGGDLAFLPSGDLLFSDSNYVFRIDRTGQITVFGGTGGFGGAPLIAERPALQSDLSAVTALETNASGEVFVGNNILIRRIDADGIVHPYIGRGGFALAGDDGPAINAQLCQPWDFTFDRVGNVFIADTNNNRVRRVDAASGIITTVVGTGPSNGYENYFRGTYTGDGGPATQAGLNGPVTAILRDDGTMFISDHGNHVVRKVSPAGTISTMAGWREVSKFVSGPGQSIFAHAGNQVYRIDGDQNRRVAGNGINGFGGDGGSALNAKLMPGGGGPLEGLAIDAEGNIFIHDAGNRRIRAVRFGAVLAPTGATIELRANGSTLRALVRDAAGRPAPGVRVDFSAPENGPSCMLSQSFAITDSTGVATVSYASNNLSGSYTVTARPLTASSVATVAFTNLGDKLIVATDIVSQDRLVDSVQLRTVR